MRKFVTALALAAMLSGCTSGGGMSSGNEPGGFCYEHTAVCVIGGVAAVGLAAAIIASNHDHDSGVVLVSDQRLKRDIKPLMVTDNGIKIYSYRYLGDNRLFSGAMAQDLLDDPKFSEAVSQDDNGFYEVDYGKLGLPVVNEAAMKEAGRKAEAIALAQMNPQ